MTKDLCCPLLGIFGNDDRAPSPEQVNEYEAALKKHGKTHELLREPSLARQLFAAAAEGASAHELALFGAVLRSNQEESAVRASFSAGEPFGHCHG